MSPYFQILPAIQHQGREAQQSTSPHQRILRLHISPNMISHSLKQQKRRLRQRHKKPRHRGVCKDAQRQNDRSLRQDVHCSGTYQPLVKNARRQSNDKRPSPSITAPPTPTPPKMNNIQRRARAATRQCRDRSLKHTRGTGDDRRP